MCADVADAYRIARNTVESAVNAVVGQKEYALPVDSLKCIGIIRDDEAFEERVRFERKKRTMDFRLRLSHSAFKAASPVEQQRMILDMLFRAISLLRAKSEDSPGFDALIADIRSIMVSNG